ncbi:hypothetical protein AN958_01596 [Leucoagaricus sp. SymC.cos]|nr:hypothetical protein AN958_01596 [Leucoagaricus sp. SymC.cos]
MATFSSTVNKTYDDTDTHLIYSGFWNHGTWNASHTSQTGTLSTSNVPFDSNVTFVAIAFYYYGILRSHGGKYGICIDCDQNGLNFITMDAVNITDDGGNPPVVLFSKHFDTPGVHRIILRNEPDNRFPNNNSQITIDQFVLEVPNSDSSTAKNGSNVGAIVGGVIGGLAAVLAALALWYCRWRKHQQQRSRSRSLSTPHGNEDNERGFDTTTHPFPHARPTSLSETPGDTPATIPPQSQPPTGTTTTRRAANEKGRHTHVLAASASTVAHHQHPHGTSLGGSSNWTQPNSSTQPPSSGSTNPSSPTISSSDGRRSRRRHLREVDAGPIPRSPNEDDDLDDDVLPPEYEQVFRRANDRGANLVPVNGQEVGGVGSSMGGGVHSGLMKL